MKCCRFFQNSQASPQKRLLVKLFFFKKKETAGLNKAEGGPLIRAREQYVSIPFHYLALSHL
jgi:hypothetical protein